MAKTTGALLSLGARGTIGKTLVFSGWRGVPYARQHVTPANPQSTAQTTTRDTFKNASSIWKGAPALLTAPWDRFAEGQKFTGRNAFMSEFVKRLRGDADLTDLLFATSAKGGTPLTSIALTPAALQITVDTVAPTPPTGWTLDSMIAAAIVDDDPETMTDFTVVAGEDDVTQNQVVLAGLQANTLYRVGAWTRWLRTDGTIAYGQSISDSDSTPV